MYWVLSMFLAFVSIAHAKSQMIRIKLEFIETDFTASQQALNSILPYPILSEKIRLGTATYYNTELITCRDGETASLESVWEFTYPTEYTPSGFDPSYLALLKQSYPPNLGINSRFCIWEIRNSGTTIEIQPAFDKGIIDLRVASEDVQLQRIETIQSNQIRWGHSDIKFPYFSPQRVNLGVPLVPERPSLIALFSKLNDRGKPEASTFIFLFVTGSIITLQ